MIRDFVILFPFYFHDHSFLYSFKRLLVSNYLLFFPRRFKKLKTNIGMNNNDKGDKKAEYTRQSGRLNPKQNRAASR